jgi:hypothetical protein
MPPLYGGAPGALANLAPVAQPPVRGCRVIQGSVWWQLLFWEWRKYRAAVASGMAGVTPPMLASKLATGVYFTDAASLQGCDGPADFAARMALSAQAHLDCQLFGCAVIEFDVPPAGHITLPPPLPGVVQGLTGGGGREWLLAGNLGLSTTMLVNYVERAPNGQPRHYHLPL